MGIRKLSTFITADALLAAVLLVWAQFWLNLPKPAAEWVSGYGLTWSLISILLALTALAIAMLASTKREGHDSARTVPDLAVALFATSLIMGIFNVGQSFVTVLAKSISGMEITESSIIPPVIHRLDVSILLLVAFVWILACSIWGATKSRYLQWTRLIVILVMCVSLFIVIYSGQALCYGGDQSYRIFFWTLIGISGFLLLGFSVLLVMLFRCKRLTESLSSSSAGSC